MSSPHLSRRHFLQTAGLGALRWPFAGAILPGASAAVAETVAAPTGMLPLNRFPRMMQEWLVDQVRAAETRGSALRDAVKTRADAEAYVESARARIREAFGPLPEKTPLKAMVTRVVEREGYRIECVIFESRPSYMVTGNLYVPTVRKQPMPGVVGVCGHSINGKAVEPYQAFAQALARLGYVCFIIDPVGQGERFQFLSDNLKSRLEGGVAEHIQMGNQQTLIGEFLGTWFAWDGIRALDYLLTRPEVDPQHVGVTGQFGRRHADHMAVRPRSALHDGRAGVLRDDLPPQCRERTPGRYRAMSAAGPGAGPGPLGLPRRDGAEAGAHPLAGIGLLRHARC